MKANKVHGYQILGSGGKSYPIFSREWEERMVAGKHLRHKCEGTTNTSDPMQELQ
jgi:hypothetical protein